MIWKCGGRIASLLQSGQRPGVLRRLRFLKTKPHSLHDGGSMLNLPGPTDLATCWRCSRASFSRILKRLAISRKSRESISRASTIIFRMVNIRSPQFFAFQLYPISIVLIRVNDKSLICSICSKLTSRVSQYYNKNGSPERERLKLMGIDVRRAHLPPSCQDR